MHARSKYVLGSVKKTEKFPQMFSMQTVKSTFLGFLHYCYEI